MKVRLVVLLLILCQQVVAQEFIPLWPDGRKPNFNGKPVTDSIFNERIVRVGTPGVYCFPVAQAENTGTAVLICPGGGYARLSHIYNGFNLAKWYNTQGISAFVLIYRLPHQTDLVNRELAPLQDAQRAMKLLRSQADKWKLIPGRTGVMGTSAGGHLAAQLANATEDVSKIKDALDTVNYRPDFAVLLSPVISLGEYAHVGSRNNLLGNNASPALIKKYSLENGVTPRNPATFIVHASNDSTVRVQNSLFYYKSLLQQHVPASYHVFPQGAHSIRLVENPGSVDQWTNLLSAWLKEMKFLVPVPFKG
ncbi:MAG: alpha/beta hydrolase [Terrimonas ferruginea]|uniref:alpha/beta hydrolase n=1 Tax=Terrimonas ferruginea TaxID=249 RepID=UPI00092710B6|nr:alpha/beta hydrolase [Terrimonas ferruginea]MBN8782321.1 alpha/beta hydrolase [Terrimonas ferruginea]OJW42843.1 MAG: pectin acetylesterase [Sphingobacteriales bacterium 48-107]